MQNSAKRSDLFWLHLEVVLRPGQQIPNLQKRTVKLQCFQQKGKEYPDSTCDPVTATKWLWTPKEATPSSKP